MGVDTLKPGHYGRHIEKTLSNAFSEKSLYLIKISQKFIPNGPIDNITAMVQIMAWCQPGAKSLSEPMMAILPMHMCITRPQ